MNALESLPLATAVPPWLPQLLDELALRGWVQLPDALDPELVMSLLDHVQQRSDLLPAAIGRGGQLQTQSNIRRDKTVWLEPCVAPVARYLEIMEQVRQALNQQLYLGLHEFEAHFARYDAGDFYRRHVDALRGQRNRIVTCVSYLNPQWQAEWGGELVLYGAVGEEIARISPRAGTSIFFLSEEFPHEVMPASNTRYSISGWFRVHSGWAH